MCSLSRLSAPPTDRSASSEARTLANSLRRRASKEAESVMGPHARDGDRRQPGANGAECFLLWMVAQQGARSVAALRGRGSSAAIRRRAVPKGGEFVAQAPSGHHRPRSGGVRPSLIICTWI